MTKALPFQKEGVRLMHSFHGRILLADEMGLGKSFQALYYALSYKEARPIIIVCPASLKYNWEHEASVHFGRLCDILSGRVAPKVSSLHVHNPILIINYEILGNWVNYLVALKPQVVIWDECHHVKNRETDKFKSLKRLIELARPPHRLALSGTPITNRPAELWTSLNLLFPKRFASFIEYGFTYCRPKLVHGKWFFTGKKNLPQLHRLLKKRCMIRRLKKDVAKDLPEKRYNTIPVELSRGDRREYELCRDHFLKWIALRKPAKLHRVKKAPHLARIGYLLRLAAQMKRPFVLDWINNFAEESEGKLVIFSCHTATIDWLHELFPKSSVVINGHVMGRDRQRAVDRFQKDPSIRYALCHPIAGGVGYNLTAAADVLWPDLPYDPATVKQGNDRIHRIGQKRPCSFWFLLARNTYDQPLCDLIIDKQSTLNEILDGDPGGRKTEFNLFTELSNHKAS